MAHRAVLAALLAALALGGCAAGRSRTVTPASLGGPAQPTCPAIGAARTLTAPVAEGCVNMANLAAMVADPRDLQQGRPLGPANGALQSLAIETYMRGPVAPKAGDAGAGAAPTLVINGATNSGPE